MNQETLDRLDLAENLGCKAATEIKNSLTFPEIPEDVNKLDIVSLKLQESIKDGADLYEVLEDSLDVIGGLNLQRLPAKSLDLIIQTIFRLDNFAEESDDYVDLAGNYELSFLLTDLLLAPLLSEETLSFVLGQESDLGHGVTGWDGVPSHYFAIAISPRFATETLDKVFTDFAGAMSAELLQNPNSSNELIKTIDAFDLATNLSHDNPYDWKTTSGIQNAITDAFPGVSAEILDLAKSFDWSNFNGPIEIFEAIIDWRLNARSHKNNFPFVSQLPRFWRE
jgi:hypothetical protein